MMSDKPLFVEPAPPGLKEWLDECQKCAVHRKTDTEKRRKIIKLQETFSKIDALKNISLITLMDNNVCASVNDKYLQFTIGIKAVSINDLTDIEIEEIFNSKVIQYLTSILMGFGIHHTYPDFVEIDDEKYCRMAFKVEKCKSCNSDMIKPNEYDIKRQLHCTRIALESDKWYRSGVCKKCVEEGNLKVECYQCRRTYPSNEIQLQIGFPADFLCKKCYGNLSAKAWDELVEKLEDEHQYDYE
jgi:hypothetical protein